MQHLLVPPNMQREQICPTSAQDAHKADTHLASGHYICALSRRSRMSSILSHRDQPPQKSLGYNIHVYTQPTEPLYVPVNIARRSTADSAPSPSVIAAAASLSSLDGVRTLAVWTLSGFSPMTRLITTRPSPQTNPLHGGHFPMWLLLQARGRITECKDCKFT